MRLSQNKERNQVTGERPSFTLIELMVVIAIIGILSSITAVTFGDQRARARNAERVTDLKKLQNALEKYYAKYGRYPYPALPNCRSDPGAPNPYSCQQNGIDYGPYGGDNPNLNCQVQYDQSWTALYQKYLYPFIDTLPTDPLDEPGDNYTDYHYTLIVGGPDDNHQHYLITANLEPAGAKQMVKIKSALFNGNPQWTVRLMPRYYGYDASSSSGVPFQSAIDFYSHLKTTGVNFGTTCNDGLGGIPSDSVDIGCGLTNQPSGWSNFNILCMGNIAGPGYWSSRDMLEKRAVGAFNLPLCSPPPVCY